MPNICCFDCVITGPKKGIDRFIQAASVHYYGKPDDPEHFWRVFNFEVCSYEQLDKDIYQVAAYGDCAWSVSGCFMNVPFSYQNIVEQPNAGTCIETICAEEGLVVEFYSNEIGMGFSEHIIYAVDTLYTDDTVDYTECDADMDLEELNKRSGLNWTQEQWDEYFQKEDYYICCEHDVVFADHIKLLEDYNDNTRNN